MNDVTDAIRLRALFSVTMGGLCFFTGFFHSWIRNDVFLKSLTCDSLVC